MFKAEDWKIKYRPTSLDQVILPMYIRKNLEGFKSGQLIQNWLFYGPPGLGKTTCSLLLRNNEYETYFLNCSLRSSVDDIKKLEQIGSSVTISGYRRLFVLDEVEKLSKEAIKSLRGIIEHLSKANDFILTANDISNLDKAVLSRLNKVDFNFEIDSKIKSQIKNRLYEILAMEGIEINKDKEFDINLLIETNTDNNCLDIRSLIGKLQILTFDWKR